MSELLNDLTIKDFLFDYSRLKKHRNEYTEDKIEMALRLPLYVKKFRALAHRMTQEQLASALDVNHTYISKIEHGRENPSSEFLDKFAEFIHSWSNNEQG